MHEQIDVVEPAVAVGAGAARAEQVGELLLALVDARHQQVDAALDRADVGRHGLLALDLDHVIGEARGEIVRRVGRDPGRAHQDDGDDDREDLAELRERVRRAQPCMPRHRTPSPRHRAAPSCVRLPRF